MRPRVVVVVPCYNEARRLEIDSFVDFSRRYRDTNFLFVNDGSTDDTANLIDDMVAGDPSSFMLYHLPKNSGKAEAVRQGMLRSLDESPEYIAMWDADLATPLFELPNFSRILDQEPRVLMVTGARVRLLGRRIERGTVRHYLGRMAATLISTVIGYQVYDTQCGAKMLRVSPVTKKLFETPFLSSWLFDVEIIARLSSLGLDSGPSVPDAIRELPLTEWRHKEGSKIRIGDYVRALYELNLIRNKYFKKHSWSGKIGQ